MAGQTLTIQQLEALWIKAGGPPSTAALGASVAMAESSGRSWITSPNPDGGTNVGPWQLDTKGVGSGHTIAQLQDPLTNAQLTVKATRGGRDWSQYQGYTNGHYTTFYAQASSVLGDVEQDVDSVLKDIGGIASGAGSAVSGAVGQVLGLPSQLTGFLTSLEAPVQGLMWIINPANVARVIAGILGALLLAAGLVALGMAA